MKILNDVWNEISNGKTNFEPKKGHNTEQELRDFQTIVREIRSLERRGRISAQYMKSYQFAGELVQHVHVMPIVKY